MVLAYRWLASWGPPRDDGQYLWGVVHPITRYMRIWDDWSMFGPLIFGLVSEATGSQRLAVLSLLPFFLVGLFLMTRVDAARAMARVRAESRT